jgi:hypothetical protein
MEPRNREEFDRILVEAITEIFRDSLGDINTAIVFQYLGGRSCPTKDIPRKLSVFSTELRALFGFGRGSMLGSAVILETAIVKTLCNQIGTSFNDVEPFVFVTFVNRLRETYVNGKPNGKGVKNVE